MEDLFFPSREKIHMCMWFFVKNQGEQPTHPECALLDVLSKGYQYHQSNYESTQSSFQSRKPLYQVERFYKVILNWLSIVGSLGISWQEVKSPDQSNRACL